MKISGYQLELDRCIFCNRENNDEDWAFSINSGGLVCDKCISHDITAIKLYNTLRKFLKVLTESDFDEITVYDKLANEKVCTFCFRVLKNYIQARCEKVFKTTEMLEMV